MDQGLKGGTMDVATTDMICKPFVALSDEECARVLALITRLAGTPPYRDLSEMRKSLAAPAFNAGRGFLTLWSEAGDLLGTAGVVTREVPVKGEAYLTSVFVDHDHLEAVPHLLAGAREVLVAEHAPPATVVRLGIREELACLAPAVLSCGFTPCYRLFEMRRDLSALSALPDDLLLEPLSHDNLTAFVTVHNAAFLASPNGGQITLGEAVEALEEAGSPDLVQLGYLQGVPVLMFELRLEGSTGWIEGLGVRPEYHRRGYGRLGLRHALATLRRHGMSVARLQVVETNANAARLYTSEGFTLDRVVATAYVADLAALG